MNEGVIRKILNLDQKPPRQMIRRRPSDGCTYVRRSSNLPSNIDISWDGDRRRGLSLRWGGGGRGGSISPPQADTQQHPFVGTRSGVARRGRCNLVPGRQDILSIIILAFLCNVPHIYVLGAKDSTMLDAACTALFAWYVAVC